MTDAEPFEGLDALAAHIRQELEAKRFVLIYAYNGVGKTRLSTAFKDVGKAVSADGEVEHRDTLYFNAFTEDLFVWDNDLENDSARKLKLNAGSSFFAGLESMEMDNRIRKLLELFADFDFRIDTGTWEVEFAREVRIKKEIPDDPEHEQGATAYETRREESIKISRGEENVFIWCFFLAIVELALDDDAEGPYSWVKYIYIDDPISSLDEHNAIGVANHLTRLLGAPESRLRTVISTHHTLFFNVLCNELRKKARSYFLRKGVEPETFAMQPTDSTPFLQHLAVLVELDQAQRSGELFTHHFTMLRRVMEQTASFLGLDKWSDCIMPDNDDDETLLKRVIDIMSHGDYSVYEPKDMMDENKTHFRTVFNSFVEKFPFNPALFHRAVEEVAHD